MADVKAKGNNVTITVVDGTKPKKKPPPSVLSTIGHLIGSLILLACLGMLGGVLDGIGDFISILSSFTALCCW